MQYTPMVAKMTNFVRGAAISLVLVAATLLAGCAVGQKFDYAQTALPSKVAPTSHAVAVAVVDQREYILSGEKKENFVGLSRGGFGNPFDVNTASGAALAQDMSASIAKSMAASAASVQEVPVKPSQKASGAKQALVATGKDRLLLFTLFEWKTDTMMRTTLAFDVGVDVLDAKGNSLAQKRIAGNEMAGDSILSASNAAQRWFNDKFGELLADKAIQQALQ